MGSIKNNYLTVFVFGSVALAGIRQRVSADTSIPSTYQEAYTEVDNYLQTNQQMVTSQWNGKKTSVLFGAELIPADSYTTVGNPGNYAQNVTPYLNGLQALGVRSVKFLLHFPLLYPPFYTWLQAQPGLSAAYPNFTLANNTAFFSKVIGDLHQRGITVVVQSDGEPATAAGSYTSDPLELTTYYYTLSFNQYVAGRAANALAVAQLPNPPDYLNFDSEPDTEGPKVLQSSLLPSNTNFVQNVNTLETTVLNTLETAGLPGLHQSLKLVVGMGQWESHLQPVLANEVALSGIDVIDIHVHLANNNYLNNIATIAQAAIASGKRVGMNEDWINKEADSEIGVLSEAVAVSRNYWSFWQPIDQLYVQDMAQTAWLYNMVYVDYSVPDVFFSYIDYNNTPACNPPTSCDDAQWDAAGTQATNTALAQNQFSATGVYFVDQTDTIPPSTPANLAATLSNGAASLTWSASTDNQTAVPLTYAIERNSVQIGTTSVLSWTDTGLASGTSYVYQVEAVDGAGNVSALSAGITLATAGLPSPSSVRVYPNPWRSDQDSSVPITFDHLTLGSTVKIFDIAGHWVKSLTGDNSVSWDRTNDNGHTVASGLYFYLITDNQGDKVRGKLTVIK